MFSCVGVGHKGGRSGREETAQDNFTDPESRIMNTSAEGCQQCYNAQVAVEGEHQLIVATWVSSNASDQGYLVRLLDDVEATHGARPATVLADAAYCNERDLATLEERGVDGHVALGRVLVEFFVEAKSKRQVIIVTHRDCQDFRVTGP